MSIKLFVVPNKMISGAALLGRDFTSNPAVKVVIDQALEILPNEPESSVKIDDFVDQVMHLEYIDELPELDLNINPSVRYDVAKNLKDMYSDVYLKDRELGPPAGFVSEPEMTICLSCTKNRSVFAHVD